MRRRRPKTDCRSNWSSEIAGKKIAVVGAGVCGLTAAIRMAEAGLSVTLFEAAPQAGGRTRSFVDTATGELCDNGPHLLIGAYEATQRLLTDCGASGNVSWQSSLQLPLWDLERRHFELRPVSWLPFPLALLLAVGRLPGHGWSSAAAMLRLSASLNREDKDASAVADLLDSAGIPSRLADDLLEPICLGAMNETMASANASTFKRVLRESFASHQSARLGWFNKPLQQGLIEPLVKHAEQLGVSLVTGRRIQAIHNEQHGCMLDDMPFDAAVIALPAYARDRLFGRISRCATHCITNIHLWFSDHQGFSSPFIGGIGTTGQWFFDVTSQMQQKQADCRHICAVISADQTSRDEEQALVDTVIAEIEAMSGIRAKPFHRRIVREKRATVLVRDGDHVVPGSSKIIDASESPAPGDLPATIEFAVQRGETSALRTITALS